MNAIFVLVTLLSSYQVGDTARAEILRAGISLGVDPASAVCVYSDSNYNIFSVYENARVTSVINYQGVRFVLSVVGKKPLQATNWQNREWTTFKDDIAEEAWKAIFYKTTPISKSRWFFLSDFFFQRGEGISSTNLKNFIVADTITLTDTISGEPYDTVITATPLNGIGFHPTYIDSFLYVAAGNGVFLGIGDTVGPFYSWTWQKLGEMDFVRPVYAVYVVDENNVLAGTDSGIYMWDGSSWTRKLTEDLVIHEFSMSPNTNTLYVATSQGIYYTTDNGNSWSLYGLPEEEVTVIRFSGQRMYIGTKGDGIFKHTEGSSDFQDFSTGLRDRFYAQIGGLNINDLLVTDTLQFAGTDVGLFMWQEDRWVNIAGNTAESTIGLNLSTEVIDSAITLISGNFDDAYQAVTQTIVDSFNVALDRIYPDFDNDPVINVLIAPVFEYVNTQADVIIDYLPLWGYFNPDDEDTTDTLLTLRDYFVINVSSMTYAGPRYLGLEAETREKVIAFLLSRMAFWQADKDEDLFILTGLSMLSTYWSGFDVSGGLIEGLEFADDFNYSLHQGSFDHPDAKEMREVDRERLFFFTEYLYEKYGRDFVDTLAKDQRNGYEALRYFVALEGDSLEDLFREWAFSNYYDDTTIYGYRNIDVEVHPRTASPSNDLEFISPWSIFYFESQGKLAFNAEDDALFDVFRVHVDYLQNEPIEQSWDSLSKRFTMPEGRLNRVWCITNVAGNTYAFAYGQDHEPPQPVFVHTVQNSVFDPVLDFFVFGYEVLYADVELNTPTVVLTNLEDSTQQYEASSFLYAQGETTYVYNAHYEIPEKGMYEVSLVAQDLVGNDGIYLRDTFGVLYLSPEGETVSFFDGEIVFEYPPGAVGGEFYVTVEKVGPEYFENLHGIKEGVYFGYGIGSPDLTLGKPASIYLEIPEEIVESGDFGLFRFSKAGLEPVYYSFDGKNTILSEVSRLGIFVLAKAEGLRIANTPSLSSLSQRIYEKNSPIPVSFTLPRHGEVKVRVFDVSGRRVADLFSGVASPGTHTLSFAPRGMNSGLYFLTLEIDGRLIKTERFVLQ